MEFWCVGMCIFQKCVFWVPCILKLIVIRLNDEGRRVRRVPNQTPNRKRGSVREAGRTSRVLKIRTATNVHIKKSTDHRHILPLLLLRPIATAAKVSEGIRCVATPPSGPSPSPTRVR